MDLCGPISKSVTLVGRKNSKDILPQKTIFSRRGAYHGVISRALNVLGTSGYEGYSCGGWCDLRDRSEKDIVENLNFLN